MYKLRPEGLFSTELKRTSDKTKVANSYHKMRTIIPLLVLLVAVFQTFGGTTPGGPTTPPPDSNPTSPPSGGGLTSAPKGTASAVTSSTFGIVFSVVGVATVRQVL
ncbi:uncharacterized protein LOC125378727 [Haliotis rufescens]|uniref:uncharacterized protein LOC125378727 n=1 Tax=Haliotis rufescens TaxID=6454 RepID=UPI00201EEE1D|nr:uncharacterized protein LOC125378727 [Haliotis rufescens]